MSELRLSVGAQIRLMRNAKGLTQQKLADIAGLDYRYIGALERGERNFSIDTLEKVLLALNVSVVELMYSNNNELGLTSMQREAINTFIAITSNLTDDQIDIILKINKEINKAFN